jgi:hypothetical protein
MAIRDTYAELIVEQIIKDLLRQGVSPSTTEINNQFITFTDEHDIAQPLFVSKDYHVAIDEISSVTKYNNCNNDIQRDLRVIYKHILKISDTAIMNFQRWRTEAQLLEGQLDALEERIASLLLLSSDTEGFFNFIQDNFVDTNRVDLANTTAYVNVQKHLVSIGTSQKGVTRLDLSILKENHVEFTVLSRNNLVATILADQSKRVYAVTDLNNYWQERVYTNRPGPVSAELKINFLSPQKISRLDIDLHMSNQNSTVQITPMYSLDNYTWQQLPVENVTRSVLDTTTFQFTPVQAQWVKLVMTKAGFDSVHNELYMYEFGVDELSFYNEGFATASAGSILVSTPLFVADTNGNPEEFSRIVLEVCESIPTNTAIDYYVSAFNDPETALSNLNFTAIDPITRPQSSRPTVLDFGDLDMITVSGITVSYAPGEANIDRVNPGPTFDLIYDVSAGAAVDATITPTTFPRYAFGNSNDRILGHEIASTIQVAKGSLEIWRNTTAAGTQRVVRGQAAGWGFEDPYYRTTVYVANASGFEVDVGGKAIIVDGTAKTGKVSFSYGRHSIMVHKDNWRTATSALSTPDLADLRGSDSLYPYNHRYLVEGYNYPTEWPSTDEKRYRGFDIIAEYFLQEVSVFDMLHNLTANDYSKFALDLDVPAFTLPDDPTLLEIAKANAATVFSVKVDESNPDFMNEQFMIRFKSANALFKYLRFKAILKTTDTTRTPYLDSYRIKISS